MVKCETPGNPPSSGISQLTHDIAIVAIDGPRVRFTADAVTLFLIHFFWFLVNWLWAGEAGVALVLWSEEDRSSRQLQD